MKPKTIRNIIVYIVALVVFAALVAGFYFYGQYASRQHEATKQQADEQAKAEAESRLPKVKVVEVMPVPLVDYLILPGTVRAYEDIDLAAKSAGTVNWVGPKEGDRIEQGEKVLTVEMKSVATRETEARVRYEQARKDYERMKKLFEEEIISKGQLDNAKTALDTSRAALDSVNVNLDDGSLESPIDGILDQLSIDPGEYISPGRTVMKIVNIDKVKVELPVPEKDILYFEPDQDVKITFDTTAGETREFQGLIEFVSMTADNTTRTYLTKVLVENPEHVLRPGMIVRAHLVRRQMDDAIAVPFFTIIDHEKSKAVFVVDDQSTARIKLIDYGIFQRGIVEVRDGLDVGERLIIVGQRKLVDGEKVDVTDDITPMAKQWLAAGKDLSELPLDILQNME
jgi:membrane fusion protein (multidrug efflux system)